MIKALIFDFDGLILETEMPDYLAWREVYEQYGVDLPLDVWSQVIGSAIKDSLFDPYAYLESLVKHPVDRESIKTVREPRYQILVANESILPGVESLLVKASERGLKTAIASSSTRSWVEGHAGRLGILEYFDVICTSDDVAKTKPDPALYLLALARLDLDATECIVFEDSPNGTLAAHRAGIQVVAVPTLLTRQLDLSLADRILNSLLEFDLDQYLIQVSTSGASD